MVALLQQLPPSARDFEVYQAVSVVGSSTRQVAQQFHISQTRVCQLATKVAKFLTEVLPGLGKMESPEEQLKLVYVAAHVASARVDHLYGVALQGWQQSQGVQATQRESEAGLRGGARVVTTRQSFGDCRYLMAAAKLAVVGSKLPTSMLTHLAGDLTDDLAGQEEAFDANEAEAATIPPVVDCSPDAEIGSEELDSNVADERVSFSLETRYNEARVPEHLTDEALWHATQLEELRRDRETTHSASSRSEPLSKQDRRARQRLLAKKLRKAK